MCAMQVMQFRSSCCILLCDCAQSPICAARTHCALSWRSRFERCQLKCYFVMRSNFRFSSSTRSIACSRCWSTATSRSESAILLLNCFDFDAGGSEYQPCDRQRHLQRRLPSKVLGCTFSSRLLCHAPVFCCFPCMMNVSGLLVALLYSSDPLCCAQAAMAIANCALEPANADVIISQQVFRHLVGRIARSFISRVLCAGWWVLSALLTRHSMQQAP
jgi:hypothetical protein